ncbi:hypothetical protein [Streptomyces sp. C]|nr:hypothetical protein [Streptomyces sp. C]EFL16748.1 predicted protein [Streptomyces sp. C]
MAPKFVWQARSIDHLSLQPAPPHAAPRRAALTANRSTLIAPRRHHRNGR